jgi:hypothetical protein
MGKQKKGEVTPPFYIETALSPIWLASHASLTFFSSSLCAGSTATHTLLFSLLVCFQNVQKN